MLGFTVYPMVGGLLTGPRKTSLVPKSKAALGVAAVVLVAASGAAAEAAQEVVVVVVVVIAAIAACFAEPHAS